MVYWIIGAIIAGFCVGYMIAALLAASHTDEYKEAYYGVIKLYENQRRINEQLLDSMRREDDGK